MALTDDASVVKRFASLSYVEHAVISARTFPNGAIVKNDVANLRRIVEVYLLGLTYTVRHVSPGWDRIHHLYVRESVVTAAPRDSNADNNVGGGGSHSPVRVNGIPLSLIGRPVSAHRLWSGA